MDHQALLHIPAKQLPISNSSTPTTTYTMAGAIIRLITVISLVALSLWANHEAAKLFEVKVLNGAKHTEVGRKFQLMFVSNGHAERLVLNSSRFAESILFPAGNYAKKTVRKVTVYFSGQEMEDKVLVSTEAENSDEFVITLSPTVMAIHAEAETAVASAIQLGMARVWLSDGNGEAPKVLVNAMAEVVVMYSGFTTATKFGDKDGMFKQNTTCWDEDSPSVVARFLKHCEGQRPGFVARLNSAMRGEFSEGMVDMALGEPAGGLCLSYISSIKVEGVVSII